MCGWAPPACGISGLPKDILAAFLVSTRALAGKRERSMPSPLMLLSGLVLRSVSWSSTRSEVSSRKVLEVEDALRFEGDVL